MGRLEKFKDATLLTYIENKLELSDKSKEKVTEISIDPSILIKIIDDLRAVGKRLSTKFNVIESAFDEV